MLTRSKIAAGVFLLASAALAQPSVCVLPLQIIAEHETTPYRAYPVHPVVAVGSDGKIAVSFRPGIDDGVKITPLAGVPAVSQIRPGHAQPIPEPGLQQIGVDGVPVTSVAVSPTLADGRRLIAIGDEQGHVDVFDARTGQKVSSLPAHNYPIRNLRFSPAGGGLLTIASQQAFVFNALDGSPIRGLVTLGNNGGLIDGGAFLPGPAAVTGTQSGGIYVWNLRDLNTRPEYGAANYRAGRAGGPVTALAVAPGDPLFATGTMTGGVGIWSPRAQPLMTAQAPSPVTGIDFSLDASRVGTSHADGSGRIWTVAGTNPVVIPGEQFGGMTSVHLVKQGRLALTSHEDGKVRLWNVEPPSGGRRKAKLIYEYEGDQGTVHGVTMLPNGKFLTNGEDGTIRLGAVPRSP